MTQNVSSKMLRSMMIQKRQSISYKTSKKDRIISIIIEADIQSNKKLLFSIGYCIYTNYYEAILRSSNSTSNDKIQNMFDNVINNLTVSEQKQLGIYNETTESSENITIRNALDYPYFTFYCSTYDNGVFKSFIINNYKTHYKLIPGKNYIFNLEDPTNYGTSVSFSRLQYLYEDVGGIYRVGTPGTTGAYIIFIPDEILSYNSVFIYNKKDPSSRSFTDFGYTYPKIHLEYLYKLPYPDNNIFKSPEENIIKYALNGSSVLHTIENKGPKYVMSSDASYNEIINDPSYVAYRFFNKISDIKKTFGMYYGHYTLDFPDAQRARDRRNRICLLNKGQNSYGISMENLIEVSGSDNDVETHYLQGLDETGELDGSYNFYYPPLTIKVLGDFEKCSVYTLKLGYNQLEDLLFFDGKYANYSQINLDGYQDASSNYNIGLQPVSQIYFHDISNDILKLNDINDVSINSRPRMSLNYKDGDSYDPDILYGLYKGQYIIKNIPEERPIAIINKDQTNSKEECIKYFGPQNYKKTRLGPDGKTLFDFFYQTLVIQVFGEFGKVSIYEYNDGFCGGENLLIYSNNNFIDISNQFQTWYEIYNDASFSNEVDCSNDDIDASNQDASFSNIYQVSSYIDCTYTTDTVTGTVNAIFFDDISTSSTRFCFNTGNYVLMNVPEDNPIAFINKDREDLFYYDGYYLNLTVSTASDGNVYNYYHGNINITVAGNFGQLSFETLTNGYLGGFRKLMYNSSGNTGDAVHHWGVTSYDDVLKTELESQLDISQTYYINVRTNTRVIYYSEEYVTYRLAGYDRNGEIDRETDNPDLMFAVGDVVYFTFDSNVLSTGFRFAIYGFHKRLEDDDLITNNNRSLEFTLPIIWEPDLEISNYYYYRSSDYITNFMKGSITITALSSTSTGEEDEKTQS